MRVAIIGGGIMGVTLGYYLAKKGVQAEIFEASPALGGLAGPIFLYDGTPVDRFYHVILSRDHHLLGLCDELEIADQLRFRQTKTGFFLDGRIHPMNNIIDFLRFPPLGLVDRLRLALTVLNAQFTRSWQDLEGISVEEWLLRWSGKNTYQKIWRPLLRARFDGSFENTPATYMWARLVRMKSTREGASQKEEAGHLIGGYISLIKAMIRQVEATGGMIHLRCPAQRILIENNRALGITIEQDRICPFDAVAVTTQVPVFSELIPTAPQEYLGLLRRTRYMGIVSALLVLDRPLSGHWTLNIVDDRFPFTGVIETTSYIDPQYVGGHHLVYLPKYTSPGSSWQQKSEEEIREISFRNLERMFPGFNRSHVRSFLLERERYVEPLHPLNSAHLIPPMRTPFDRLFLVTTAQIYPALTNGEAVVQHARQAADLILE